MPIRFSADHRLRQMWERSRPGNENCSLDRVSVPMIFVSQRCIVNEWRNEWNEMNETNGMEWNEMTWHEMKWNDMKRIDWLIDCLIDCLIAWLIDWWIDWLIDWLTDWWIDGRNEWLMEGMNEWMNEGLNEWMHEYIKLNCGKQNLVRPVNWGVFPIPRGWSALADHL